MLIEFGNHAPAFEGIDDRPKVTYLNIPEADNTGQGGYSHEVGLSAGELEKHLIDAIKFRGGITHLPDHEVLLSAVSSWTTQAHDKPAWVKVRSHEELFGAVKDLQHPLGEDGNPLKIAPHSAEKALDIENILREYYELPDTAEKPPDVEDRYWTRYGQPGVGLPQLPPLEALYLDNGRVISNVNDGGGQVGLAGTGTAATATTLTTGTAMTTNVWAGYRVYVMQTATGPIVWGNVLSNTSGGVLTVDRWYSAATPGGAAPSAPSAGWYYQLADGGNVSTWFVALTTTNITPAHGDTNLSGEYTTASGGFLRKISPYTQTSGVASRSLTLVPVFTGNGSDTYPSTFYAIGVFGGMVVTSSTPFTPYKFETSLNASATVNASGDQLTVTETVTGS